MILKRFALGAIAVAAACSSDRVWTEPGKDPFPSVFVGEWRSVTPTLEFIRLTVHSKSSEQGVLAARLTYSGLYWEGDGRVDSDSLVTNMHVPGASGPNSRLVLRSSPNENTLQVQHHTDGGLINLTFIREN
jgi:hypothetical protein